MRLNALIKHIDPQSPRYAAISALSSKINCKTVEDLVLSDPKKVSEQANIDISMVQDLIQWACEIIAPVPSTALITHQKLLDNMFVSSTGSNSLDELLDGGILNGQIVEIFGEPGSGKTQFCLSVCSQIVTQENGSVLWLDGNRSFSAQRFQEILLEKQQSTTTNSQESNSTTIEKYLQRLKHYPVYDVFGLLEKLQTLQFEISAYEQHQNTKVQLIVVEGLPTLLSPLLNRVGRGYNVGYPLLAAVAGALKNLANTLPASILITNTALGKSVESKRTGLGEVWMQVPSIQLYLEAQPATNSYQATVTYSSRKPSGEKAEFYINNAGISDEMDTS